MMIFLSTYLNMLQTHSQQNSWNWFFDLTKDDLMIRTLFLVWKSSSIFWSSKLTLHPLALYCPLCSFIGSVRNRMHAAITFLCATTLLKAYTFASHARNASFFVVSSNYFRSTLVKGTRWAVSLMKKLHEWGQSELRHVGVATFIEGDNTTEVVCPQVKNIVFNNMVRGWYTKANSTTDQSSATLGHWQQ